MDFDFMKVNDTTITKCNSKTGDYYTVFFEGEEIVFHTLEEAIAFAYENLSTIKLPAYNRRDAVQIIKSYGFLDETPDVCTMTHKLFTKNGHTYMCDGWCDLNKDRYYDNVLMHRVK